MKFLPPASRPLLLFACVCLCVLASVPLGLAGEISSRPRLIVVVSVDQLPARYLTQWQDRFADDGLFRRLMREGAWYANCHHRHAFTLTGPGHSTMLTGADPARTGIVGNEWFDRATGKTINCVDDADAQAVGAPTGEPSSPRNLLVPTLGDELKLATGGKSKVFGISWKDRSGILMSGHAADAAYWFDEKSGKWVTSTYYRDDMPGYLRNLNEGGLAESFVGKSWELLYPADQYDMLVPDDSPHETNYPIFGRVFPHPLPKKADGLYYKALGLTPFGSDLTLAAASAILEHEKLGQDDATDLLCVGLSANDYVGHSFGPHSLEVQDITFRTDRQLAAFFNLVQEKLGDQPWVFVLSSDHGVAPIPEVAAELKVSAIRNPLGDTRALQGRIEERLRAVLGSPAGGGSYVQKVEPQGIFLQRDLPELAGANFELAQDVVRALLLDTPHVAAAYTRAELSNADPGEGISEQFRLAFHPARSPDVLFALAPYCLGGSNATTHGSPWEYDSHIPLFFLGSGIKPGQHDERVGPVHIGPTLAKLLGVEAPAGSVVPALDSALER